MNILKDNLETESKVVEEKSKNTAELPCETCGKCLNQNNI